jgi:hypothetical protein
MVVTIRCWGRARLPAVMFLNQLDGGPPRLVTQKSIRLKAPFHLRDEVNNHLGISHIQFPKGALNALSTFLLRGYFPDHLAERGHR